MPDFTFLLDLANHPAALAWALLGVVVAYAVFTLVGFGSALMASGPLAMLMPVGKVIPLLAILDFAGSSLRGWRARKEVAWGAFMRLFPGMLAGQLLGVLVLAQLPPALMAVALGGFVVVQGLKGLIKRQEEAGLPRFAFGHGLFGGVLGGLFGSGGFIYAAYLERTLESRTAFRATQAALIALSTAWRIVLCLSLGLLDLKLLATALAFVPAMALGVYTGHHIDLRISRQQLFRLLNGLLVVSGASLVLRYLA
ncbi:sulfite exporter TauE/SafE family protein [Dechloromonas sp. XY25]|uniref:Probable membrane transporter protein n=1 Tax=Dechloromonas hankyongensis TaxID=2908002 RepID=A0ABS9K543_9RHOO|nr:sulfite exporter TauE/SafE family protein [Dechloromonas hankyongensis]MCG2578282.1 sulfite exporter TauE/SafE family protein [Dechloromonas hankyongensis]